MIYKSAIEQLKDLKNNPYVPFKLAKVTSLSSGRAYVKFYGESTASSKLYPYIEGYKPTVNDDVLMVEQGSTFIIMGKVSKDNITDNYYLLKSVADAAYLTKAVADTLYEPLGGGGGGDTDHIENTYYTFGFASASSRDLVGTGGTLPLNIGNTSSKFNAGYFDTLGGNSSSNAIQSLYAKDFWLYGNLKSDIVPTANNSYDLGSSSYKFRTIYTNSLNISTINATKWQPNSNYSNGIDASGSNSSATFSPSSNGKTHLGTSSYRFGDMYLNDLYPSKIHFGNQTYNVAFNYSSSSNMGIVPSNNKVADLGSSSYQFKNCYANQFYQNGTAISTSDRRKKTGIKDITKKYVEFFKKLKPKLFRFKDGESGRLHSGFIAQDVEEAAGESGIPTKDLAFLCIDEEGNYGLRYEELIAIQTKVIQDLLERVEKLEKTVKEAGLNV